MEDKNKILLDWIENYENWDYEKALSLFDKALSLNTKNIPALFYKWNTLWALWNFNAAIEYFNSVLKIEPDNKKVINAKEVFSNLSKNSTNTSAEMTFMKAPMPSNASMDTQKIEEEFWIKEKQALSEVSKKWFKTKKIKNIPNESLNENDNILEFLKKNEIKNFFESKKDSNWEINNVEINISKNIFDEERLKELLSIWDTNTLIDFLSKMKLRNSFIEYLADSNILAPRKYNTITSQINDINAEYWLAYLMFNLWEIKYNEILSHINNWIKFTQVDLGKNKDYNINTWETERLSIIKESLRFIISIFSFEKAFSSEKNKLKFFHYLFTFIGFLALLILVWYWIRNAEIKADIKNTTTKEVTNGKEVIQYQRNSNIIVNQ